MRVPRLHLHEYALHFTLHWRKHVRQTRNIYVETFLFSLSPKKGVFSYPPLWNTSLLQSDTSGCNTVLRALTSGGKVG